MGRGEMALASALVDGAGFFAAVTLPSPSSQGMLFPLCVSSRLLQLIIWRGLHPGPGTWATQEPVDGRSFAWTSNPRVSFHLCWPWLAASVWVVVENAPVRGSGSHRPSGAARARGRRTKNRSFQLSLQQRVRGRGTRACVRRRSCRRRFLRRSLRLHVVPISSLPDFDLVLHVRSGPTNSVH